MRYYIYVLLDSRFEGNYDNRICEIGFKPFYIGKGDNDCKNGSVRYMQHYKYVLSENEEQKKSNPYKFNLIKKLFSLGYEPNFKIIFESDSEEEVFNLEKELISFYKRNIEGGILVNIADGGFGGDTFTNNPKKEEIREKHRLNALGSNNKMYGLDLEKRPSHIAKINGNHWNKGKVMTIETKEKIKKSKMKNLFKVIVVDILTLEEIETLTTKEAIEKYNLNTSGFYRSLNRGGAHKGYYWKYENMELVMSTSKNPNYIKPKREKGYAIKDGNTIYVTKKVYYKKNIDDDKEVEFSLGIEEAALYFNLCTETIRRKCRLNNSNENIFRYENKDYIFDVKKGVKRKIRMIKGDEIFEFESITQAAEEIDGKITSILAVCKGRNKTYRGLKFEYVENK
jgi:hypothetical protein